MLSSLRRLWARQTPAAAHEAPRRWARASGGVFKHAREADGFVVEWKVGDLPARLEWGPSTRPYIGTSEVRLRGELRVPDDLQILLMARGLMQVLESEVFAQATGAVQTHLDGNTPEEMRWLVLLPGLALPRGLELRIGAVGNAPVWLDTWVGGDFADALAQQPADVPFVLMVHRGRLTLRSAMALPQVEEMTRLRTLFDAAMRRAPAATEALAGPDSGTL